MPLYVALVSYTERGIQAVKHSPKRLDAAKTLLREMGGEVRQVLMTMGQYDLILIYDAVDDATAARFTLSLGMLGHVRTQTMKAFPEAAYREIIASIR